MWAKCKQRSSGFTIVELLIVIVVIGILAAITIVAYTGFQERARNTVRLSAARSIYTQLELYTRQTGNNWSTSIFCIPTEANYTAGNGGLSDCFASNDIRSEDATMNTNFSNAGYKFSYPATPITNPGGISFYGIHVAYGSNLNQGMNGVLRPYILIFFLEGSNQDCGSNSVSYDGSKVTSDPLNSIIPARNYTYDSKVTWCFLSLTHSSTI